MQRSAAWWRCGPTLAVLTAMGCVPAGERPLATLVGTLAPDSELAGCDRADEAITVVANSRSRASIHSCS